MTIVEQIADFTLKTQQTIAQLVQERDRLLTRLKELETEAKKDK